MMHQGKLLFQIIFHQVVIISVNCYDSTKLLSTRAGKFKGTVRELDVFGETKRVERYFGVPYAEPPLRFRKSVIKAPLSTETIYDATKFKPACCQQEMSSGGVRKPGVTIGTSEDCLFLNIYKPKQEIDEGMAVMVWFHGGGFVVGSPQMYSGDMLSARGEVIVVTVAYRLSIWGFMSTGDEILPGNLGLWDQHIALRWVHENIKAFGGNPDSVTLFGFSAGSASVLYQSLFPANRGYFQRAIGMSGSITCPWSFQPKPLDIIVRFGSLLGCDTKVPTKELVHCIESKSGEELYAVLNKKENGYIKFPMEFVTVVDGEFLKSNPYKIISGETVLSPESAEFFASLDFMTGVASMEGAMNIGPFVGIDDPENFALTRKEFEKNSVAEAVRLMYGDDVQKIIADIVIHEYTDWSFPDSLASIRNSFLEMTGDYVFNFHAKLLADTHVNLSLLKNSQGRTFAYLSDAFPSQHVLLTPSWLSRPNHGDDRPFLFGYDKEGLLSVTEPFSEDYEPAVWEIELSKLYMTGFSNFAKTG